MTSTIEFHSPYLHYNSFQVIQIEYKVLLTPLCRAKEKGLEWNYQRIGVGGSVIFLLRLPLQYHILIYHSWRSRIPSLKLHLFAPWVDGNGNS